MEILHWEEQQPRLRRPVLVSAFEGWNDAGDAASLAVSYLADAWSAHRVAVIDPEEFYDFTETRPQVRLVDGIDRQIDWPTNELWVGSIPGEDRDVILLRGVEPQLRWRTFCRTVVEASTSMGVELAVSLGALLADVPHTRPVKVSGSADDHDLSDRLSLQPSRYEGPTGIVGVLTDAYHSAGLPCASLWAAVPHYVHQVPSPKAALALVERSARLLGATVNPVELIEAAGEYERQVSERVAADDEAAAYVAQLEQAEDHEESVESMSNTDGLADEVERFLREHRRDGI